MACSLYYKVQVIVIVMLCLVRTRTHGLPSAARTHILSSLVPTVSRLFPKFSSGLQMHSSTEDFDLLLSRFGQENFAGKWQSKGDFYVSYENLQYLDDQLRRHKATRSKKEKRALLRELTLTYFARFHNLLRNEYQYEKDLVEERIKTWSPQRLKLEGFTLFDMIPQPRGALFQDKVYRFKTRSDGPLPFHRFSVGDSVRISISGSKGGPLDEKNSIDGAVLDRRLRYIDICVKADNDDSNKPLIDTTQTYRVDNFVNRIAYDRMMNSLTLFVQLQGDGGQDSGGEHGLSLSRGIRDLILYSYPGSLMLLANSPGGLKLGLPYLSSSRKDGTIVNTSQTKSSNIGNTEGSDLNSMNSEREESFTPRSTRNNVDPKVVLGQKLESRHRPFGWQQEDQLAIMMAASTLRKATTNVLASDGNSTSDVEDQTDFTEPKPKHVTIADAMNRVKIMDKSLKVSSYNTRIIEETVDDSAGSSDEGKENERAHKAVFQTNDRLRAMAETMPTVAGTIPYTTEEVKRAVNEVIDIDLRNKGSNTTSLGRLNPSQISALMNAIMKPLTLIQGPPGTGKTRTACAILATLVHIRDAREREGGDIAKGLKQHKILACAQSNVAADNLLEGCIKLGVNAVRFGRPVNVRSNLWNHTVDARLQERTAWIRARERLDIAVESYNDIKKRGVGGEELGQAQRLLGHAKTEFQRIESKCVNDVLRGAQVVVTSCIGASSEPLKTFANRDSVRFSTVLIDEATQCTELAAINTMVLGCERLILIGDQNQLPPVILSPVAAEKGLGASLFSRLVTAGLQPQLLDEQYRMHPRIAQFSSSIFYEGLVKSEVDPGDRILPKGFEWSNVDVPISFIDVNHRDALNIVSSTGESAATIPISGGFERLTEAITAFTVERASSSSTSQGTVPNMSATTSNNTVSNEDYASSSSSLLSLRKVSLLSRIRYEQQQQGDAVVLSGPRKGKRPKGSRSEGIESQRATSSQRATPSAMNVGASSYYNIAEADVIENIVHGLLSEGDVPLGNIGVISPYNAQVRLLLDKFRVRGWTEMGANASKNIEQSSTVIRSRSAEGSTKKASLKASVASLPSLNSVGNIAPVTKGENCDEEFQDTNDTSIMYKADSDGKGNEADKRDISNESNSVEVRSVDGYQGREKDIIIISAVRSNRAGRVGFLRDWRRLNVAVTRAKSGLIVVGDSATLSRDPNWKAFIEYCRENDCVMKADKHFLKYLYM